MSSHHEPAVIQRQGSSEIGAAAVVLPISKAGWLRPLRAADFFGWRRYRGYGDGGVGRARRLPLMRSLVHDQNVATKRTISTLSALPISVAADWNHILVETFVTSIKLYACTDH